MNIKSCYVPKDKAHITICQELQHFKQTRKGVIIDYSDNIKASISSLQNKSSAAIKLTIHSSYKSITSSNETNSSEIPGLTSALNVTTDSSSISFSNGSLVFGIDGNYQKNNYFQRDSSYYFYIRYYYLRRTFL